MFKDGYYAVFFTGLVIGIFLSTIIDKLICNAKIEELQKIAIEQNCGHYSPTTGNFLWETKK